jgi:hypothetical protein
MENKTNKQIIDQYKQNVSSAYPSIYTKDDVSKLLDDLSNELQPNGNLEDLWGEYILDGIYDEVYKEVDNKIKQCYEIDSDDCELSLDYKNTIVVDDVAIEFDKETLSDYITTAIKNYLTAKLKPQTELQTENN